MCACTLMHLSVAIPGGVTPGTHGGIARDLPSFVANNFWPGTGYWNAFALPRQDTWGKTCGICNIVAILKMGKHTGSATMDPA